MTEAPKSYSSREIVCATPQDVHREERILQQMNYRFDTAVDKSELVEEIRRRFALNLHIQEIVYLPVSYL